jgi:SAM-dependent methyltransferase
MSSTTRAHGWQLETDSAEAYERYLVPALMAQGAERLVELTAPRPGERVLDVGCGTGAVARRVAGALGARGRVVGVDVNEGMLRVAKAVTPAEAAVEWKAASATSLPFPDASFDVVLSQQMLQFVPEPAMAVREMHRVLAPGGRLAISVCRPLERAPGYVPLVVGLRKYVGPEAEAMMRSPFPPWSVERLRELVSTGGFAGAAIRIEVMTVRYPSAAEFLRREAACSPLAGLVGALGAEARAALVQELERALEPCTDDEGVVLSLEVYVARARR